MASEKVRRQIASEAARLIYARHEAVYHRAKRTAARQLGHGWVSAAELPSNREVRDELHTWVRRHQGENHRDELRELRRAALTIMRQLRSFRPRLSGDALTGQIRGDSVIEIQLVADDLPSLLSALAADRLSYVVEQRAVRIAGQDYDLPLVRLDGPFAVELTVFNKRLARKAQQSSQADRAVERAGTSELEALLRHDEQHAASGDEELLPGESSGDRFEVYASLLLPLERVKQNRVRHPEGDALYHSLQVFARARDKIPYDEEFLSAALLHDVGKGIDRLDHVAAGLEALDGAITPRTAWLIEQHPQGHALRDGTLGARSRRRLAAHDDYDELMLLVQCDREGRCCGAQVPDVEEALQYLRDLSRSCEAP